MKIMTWALTCFLVIAPAAYGAESEASSGSDSYTYGLSGYESYFSDTEDKEVPCEVEDFLDALLNYLHLTVASSLPCEVFDTHAAPRCSALSVSEEEKQKLFTVTSRCHNRNFFSSVALSADGKIAISTSDDHTVKVWDVGAGELLRTLDGHSYWANSSALSADGKTAVSGSDDHTVKVWDVDEGKLLRILYGHDYWVNSVALSADGKIAISGSVDQAVKVWDVGAGQLLRTLRGHPSQVESVALSADGKIAVSGSHECEMYKYDCLLHPPAHWNVRDYFCYKVNVWNIGTERPLFKLDGRGRVCSVAISADGSRVAVATFDHSKFTNVKNRGEVKIWNVDSRQRLCTLYDHEDRVSSIALSADGKTAAGAVGDTVRVWGVDDRQLVHTLRGHGRVCSVALSADGKKLISGLSDEAIQFWCLFGIEWAKRKMTLPQYGLIKSIMEFGETCKEKEQPLSLSVLAWRLLGLGDGETAEDKDAATIEVASLFNSIPPEPRECLVRKNNMLPVCLSAENEPRVLCSFLDESNDYKPRTWPQSRKNNCCCIVS